MSDIDVDVCHYAVEERARLPKELWAVMVAGRDPQTGRKKTVLMTYITKAAATRQFDLVKKKLKDETAVLLCAGVTDWEEIG